MDVFLGFLAWCMMQLWKTHIRGEWDIFTRGENGERGENTWWDFQSWGTIDFEGGAPTLDETMQSLFLPHFWLYLAKLMSSPPLIVFGKAYFFPTSVEKILVIAPHQNAQWRHWRHPILCRILWRHNIVKVDEVFLGDIIIDSNFFCSQSMTS